MDHEAMPEYMIGASATVLGYLAVALRAWVHTRGLVQLEKVRGTTRR